MDILVSLEVDCLPFFLGFEHLGVDLVPDRFAIRLLLELLGLWGEEGGLFVVVVGGGVDVGVGGFALAAFGACSGGGGGGLGLGCFGGFWGRGSGRAGAVGGAFECALEALEFLTEGERG